MTEERTFIMTNGIPTATWSAQGFQDYRTEAQENGYSVLFTLQ